MKLIWSVEAWEDYLHWQTADPAVLTRINSILKEIRRDPFRGIAKPEPLRGALAGWWSRRITAEHRLVYRVRGTGEEQAIEIAQCRFHY